MLPVKPIIFTPAMGYMSIQRTVAIAYEAAEALYHAGLTERTLLCEGPGSIIVSLTLSPWLQVVAYVLRQE